MATSTARARDETDPAVERDGEQRAGHEPAPKPPRSVTLGSVTGYELLRAEDAAWRASNQMGVANTNLGAQLGAEQLAARLWRLTPGQASTRHRHARQTELYVVLEGTGRIRIDEESLTLSPHSALLVHPRTVRQVFNDTECDALWLVAGAPPEPADTLTMSPEQLTDLYPEGPRALPRELGG